MFKNRGIPTKAQEEAEDIFFGQIAIIWARWFLIAAGTIIAMWSGIDENQFTLGIITLVVLMSLNFYAHGRYLTGKPVNKFLLLVGNLVDLSVITALVMFWDKGHTGLESEFFILYYPMLFAWALVFSPPVTVLFTAIVLGVYTAACVFSPNYFTVLFGKGGANTLISHLITLGAMGGLGTYYYRRQRDSLRALLANKTAPIFK